jgi:hypothetical protein
MKKDVFNPAEWGAAGMEKVKKEPSPAVGVSAQQSAILAVVEAVEASGIDITASYPTGWPSRLPGVGAG